MNRAMMWLWSLGLAAAVFALTGVQAHASVSADEAAFRAFYGTVAGTSTGISVGSTGIPLATSAFKAAGWVQAGNMGVAAAATPALGMVVKGTAMVEAAPGVMVPVVAASSITGANLWAGLKAASAIGASLVGGPWGVAFLGAGAVLDWMTQAGVRPNPDGSGTLQRSDPNVCTTAPCYLYSPGQTVPYSSSRDGGCAAYAVWYAGQYSAGQHITASADHTTTTGGSGYGSCFFNVYQNGAYLTQNSVGFFAQSTPPSAANWLPSSMDDIAPYMQGVQPSPNVVQQILGTGASVQAEPVTVTAPLTVAGPTTTTQNSDGTKTVTQTTYNFSTAGNTITNNGPTVTTTTYNSDNSVKSTSTTSTAPAPDSQDPSPADSALPDQPKLYTPKYPQGLVGVWNTQSQNLKSTALVGLASSLMPSIPDGGACPAWNMNLNLARWANFGTVNVAPPCYVWDWCRLIILVGALFLCRALIFGG